MKNLTRSVVLVLSLTLLLSMVSSVYAQDYYCFNLGEDDCALYYELAESAETPLSSAFELNVNTDMVIDIPDAEDEMSFGIFVNGAYVIDAEVAEAAVDEFESISVLDVSARTFLNLGRGVLESFDAELSLDYDFPEEAGMPPIGPFNIWLVDGVGYVDVTPLQMMGMVEEAGVFGLDLFDVIEVPLSQVELGDLFADMDMGDSSGGDFDFDFDDMFDEDGNLVIPTEFDEETLASFENGVDQADLSEEEIASFVSMERADDETVDGVDVIVFVTTVDIAAIMEVESIAEQAYQSAVDADLPDDISQEDFAEALADSLAGSIVTVTEKIDPETGIAMAVVIEMDMTFDIEPFAAMTGEQEEGTIVMNIVTEFVRSDVNAIDEIELPEDAQEIPVEALLGGF